MGSLQQIMAMIPGMSKMAAGAVPDEKSLVRVEAIIQSMTTDERRKPNIINGTRRRRIASGSGTSVQEVNKVLKQFHDMQKMMKTLSKGRMPKMFRGMKMPV